MFQVTHRFVSHGFTHSFECLGLSHWILFLYPPVTIRYIKIYFFFGKKAAINALTILFLNFFAVCRSILAWKQMFITFGSFPYLVETYAFSFWRYINKQHQGCIDKDLHWLMFTNIHIFKFFIVLQLFVLCRLWRPNPHF